MPQVLKASNRILQADADLTNSSRCYSFISLPSIHLSIHPSIYPSIHSYSSSSYSSSLAAKSTQRRMDVSETLCSTNWLIVLVKRKEYLKQTRGRCAMYRLVPSYFLFLRNKIIKFRVSKQLIFFYIYILLLEVTVYFILFICTRLFIFLFSWGTEGVK